MKKLYTYVICQFLLIAACSVTLFSQGIIIPDNEIPDIYSKFYKIQTKLYNKVWDQYHTNNVYGAGYYHGGTNQQWLIMPTYPGSTDVIIANKHSGRICDRYHTRNLHTGEAHMGDCQLFTMEKVNGNYFTIWSKNYNGVITKYLSNNLGVTNGSVDYSDDQQHYFTPVANIPNSDKLTVFKETEGLELPPQPVSLNDPGDFREHSKKLISSTFIPYTLVNDVGRSDKWKIDNSPYYILEKYQYYQLMPPIHTPYGVGRTWGFTDELGYSITEFHETKTTVGLELNFQGKIAKGTKRSITGNLKKNMSMSETNSISIENSHSATRQTSYTKEIIEGQRIFEYLIVEHYVLKRMNSSVPILEWRITPEYEPVLWSYPNSDFNKDNKKSVAGDIEYIQVEAENLIPSLRHNYIPPYAVPVATSSSKYSSSYDAWKAFDGEDETAPWSRWISKPSGSFSPQWLAFEFYSPRVIKAYNVTPETGGCINRTPNTWKLQAFNGSAWVTIDSQSGFTRSDWTADNSRDFNIKYPKAYRRFGVLLIHPPVSGVTL